MSSEKCNHCPFRFKTNPEGADFDDSFDELDVRDWISMKPFWPCHKHPELHIPCSGQALFRSGNGDVTEEDLVRFWVLLEPFDMELNQFIKP